jgi:hypothetical protein
MEAIYNSPITTIATISVSAGVFITFLVIYFLRRNKAHGVRKTNKGKEAGIIEALADLPPEIAKYSPTGQVNALVMDDKTRSFGLRWLNMRPGADYGRLWLYGNHNVFWLQKKRDGTILPVVPEEDMDHSPGELYEALQTRDDIDETIAPQKGSDSKIKIGLLVAAACVALFLMFLAAKG